MPLTTPSLFLSLTRILIFPLAVSPAPSFPSWDRPRLTKHIDNFQAASGSNNIPDMSDLIQAGALGAEDQAPRLPPLPPLLAPVDVGGNSDEWYYPEDEAGESVAVGIVVKARGEREVASPRPTGAARPMPKRVVELKGTVVVRRPRTRTGRERSRSTLRMEMPGDEE